MNWLKDNISTVLGIIGTLFALIGTSFGSGLYINNKIKSLVTEDTEAMSLKIVALQARLDTAVQEKTYYKDMTDLSQSIKDLKEDMCNYFDKLTTRIDAAVMHGV